MPYGDLPREEPERTRAFVSTSAAQSRRAKNAAHRADDVGEFQLSLRLRLHLSSNELNPFLYQNSRSISAAD